MAQLPELVSASAGAGARILTDGGTTMLPFPEEDLDAEFDFVEEGEEEEPPFRYGTTDTPSIYDTPSRSRSVLESPFTACVAPDRLRLISPRQVRELGQWQRQRGEEGWCARHHVSASRNNHNLSTARRVYFDSLPQLRVRSGTYADVPFYIPHEDHDSHGYQFRVRWKLANYPVQSCSHSPGNSSPVARDFSPGGSLSQCSARNASPNDRATSSSTGPALPNSATHGSRGGDNSVADAPVPIQEEDGGGDDRQAGAESQWSINLLAEACARSSGDRRKAARADAMQRKNIIGKPELANMPSAEAYSHFVDWCITKYGNLVNAWRKLDKNGNMSLSKLEFMRALREAQYRRTDTKKLWKLLDRDQQGDISFLHFAPEAAAELAKFKRWVDEKYGSMREAFLVFDIDGSGKIPRDEFLSACNREGIPKRLNDSVRVLFDLMDDRTNKVDIGVLTLKEVSFIDAWKFPPYLFAEPSRGAATAFREALKSEFGNNLIVWRKFLDFNQDMRVNYNEFYNACKKLARLGIVEAEPRSGVVSIFCAMDSNRSGWVSFHAWDQEGYRVLATFTTWVRKFFGKAVEFVKQHEEGVGNGITLEAFERATADGGLGMTQRESDILWGGLSLKPIWRHPRRGSLRESSKSSVVTTRLIQFLDRWDMQGQLEEEQAWERMANARGNIFLARSSTATLPRLFDADDAGSLNQSSTAASPVSARTPRRRGGARRSRLDRQSSMASDRSHHRSLRSQDSFSPRALSERRSLYHSPRRSRTHRRSSDKIFGTLEVDEAVHDASAKARQRYIASVDWLKESQFATNFSTAASDYDVKDLS